MWQRNGLSLSSIGCFIAGSLRGAQGGHVMRVPASLAGARVHSMSQPGRPQRELAVRVSIFTR